MRAVGDHILVELPPPPTTSEGGIHLAPGAPQANWYGRVLEVGDAAKTTVAVGDIVVFNPDNREPLRFSSLEREKYSLVVLPADAVFCVIGEEELVERRLQVPNPVAQEVHST